MGPSFKISSLLLFHRVRYVPLRLNVGVGSRLYFLYYFLIHANNHQSIPYYFHFRPKVGPLKGKKRFQVSLNLKPSILKYLSSKPARNQQHLHLPPTRLDIRESEKRGRRETKKTLGNFWRFSGVGFTHLNSVARFQTTFIKPRTFRHLEDSAHNLARRGDISKRRPTSPRRTRHRHLAV